MQIPSTPRSISRGDPGRVVDRPGDHLHADGVRRVDQRRGDQRVVDPDRPGAQLRRAAADDRRQAGAQERGAGEVDRGAAALAARPVAADLRQRPAARRVAGRGRAGRRRCAPPSSRSSPARSARARAAAATTSSSRPPTLRSRSKRSRSSGGRVSASRPCSQGSAVRAERRRPSRGRSAAAWSTVPGPRGRVAPVVGARSKSERGRRTSNSIASTPASTAAAKLSSVLPGAIASAPLWPIRRTRATVATSPRDPARFGAMSDVLRRRIAAAAADRGGSPSPYSRSRTSGPFSDPPTRRSVSRASSRTSSTLPRRATRRRSAAC